VGGGARGRVNSSTRLRDQFRRLGGVVAQVGQQPGLAVRQSDASGLTRSDQPDHPHAAAQLEHILVQEEVRLASGAEPAGECDAAVPQPAARAEAQLAKLANLHRLARREAHGPLLKVCRGVRLLLLRCTCADVDALAALHDIARRRQSRERLRLASARCWSRLLGGESRGLAGARRIGRAPCALALHGMAAGGGALPADDTRRPTTRESSLKSIASRMAAGEEGNAGRRHYK